MSSQQHPTRHRRHPLGRRLAANRSGQCHRPDERSQRGACIVLVLRHCWGRRAGQDRRDDVKQARLERCASLSIRARYLGRQALQAATLRQVASAPWAEIEADELRPPRAAVLALEMHHTGLQVRQATTDVSHADVAEAKGANFAPRLADALPVGPPVPGRRSSVDKVYAVTNFKHESIFASAPFPMGSASRDRAYSPLWQMVKVTWAVGKVPQTLKSEEAVLAAVDSGAVTLEPTSVVLNCPIVHRGPKGALPGVSLVHPVR